MPSNPSPEQQAASRKNGKKSKGRTPKSDEEKKGTPISIRVTEAEREHIVLQARVSHLSLTEFCLRAILGRKIIAKTDMTLLNELRRIGGLLKHIHNASGGAYSAKTAAILEDIHAAIARIANDR